jgi:hypothetical protein
MKNNYGNYVIEKALSLADKQMQEDLGVKIKEQIPFLTNRQLKAKWNHYLDQCSHGMVSQDPLLATPPHEM